jgi:hypothetical protein
MPMNQLDPRIGGRTGMTVKLRSLFDRYNYDQQGQGLEPLEWPMWLQENGFKLGDDKLVTPLADTDVDRLLKIYSSQ